VVSTTKRTAFCLASVLVLAVATPGRAPNSDASFDRLMADAMERMAKDMAITHGGDPDRDFAAMMIPHHQGAIDMAKAELQFGHDPVMRRLAQGIIVQQQQEIALMRRELERLAPRGQQGVVK